MERDEWKGRWVDGSVDGGVGEECREGRIEELLLSLLLLSDAVFLDAVLRLLNDIGRKLTGAVV